MTLPLQSLMNAPSAVGGALGMPGRTGNGPGSAPRYGLAMWFKVVVDQAGGTTQSLGRWSGCSGLGVTFKPDDLREGGDYNGPLHLPGEIDYAQIVLERAMTRPDSDAVRAWLSHVAANWINADNAAPGSGSAGYEGAKVTITLYTNLRHAAGEWIAKWELRDVIPVAWSGPALSAKSNEIAVEKLTLAHRGFLDASAPSAKPGGAAQPDQGKLRISLDSDSLPLQYNPLKVGLERSVQIKSDGVNVTRDQQVVESGQLSIKLNDLRVEGVTKVHETVEKLLSWMEPEPPAQPTGTAPTAGGGTGESNAATGKVLTVQMGAGTGPGRIEHKAILKSVSVTYTRFTSTSVPSRAVLSLTLQGADVPVPKQNPTSGGPPGGRVHTVIAGDNLQRIATASYGSPSSWRRIAEANDVDDPLRVRNGHPVYLPAR
jgi:phage tail-like protein